MLLLLLLKKKKTSDHIVITGEERDPTHLRGVFSILLASDEEKGGRCPREDATGTWEKRKSQFPLLRGNGRGRRIKKREKKGRVAFFPSNQKGQCKTLFLLAVEEKKKTNSTKQETGRIV